jgi:hypothetical protein
MFSLVQVPFYNKYLQIILGKLFKISCSFLMFVVMLSVGVSCAVWAKSSAQRYVAPRCLALSHGAIFCCWSRHGMSALPFSQQLQSPPCSLPSCDSNAFPPKISDSSEDYSTECFSEKSVKNLLANVNQIQFFYYCSHHIQAPKC